MSRALRPLNRKLYDNCKVYNCRGELIFFSNKKKVDWYLNKKLATLVDDNLCSIRLTFETNGPGCIGDKFYLQDREDLCAVCGEKENLTRHHVVPFQYKKHLPSNMKNHSFHDILPLCVKCHMRYEDCALNFKKQIAKEYNIPAEGYLVNKDEVRDLRWARSLARTLLKYSDKIPQDKKTEMLNNISLVLKKPSITKDDLFYLDELEIQCDVITHGRAMIEKLSKSDIVMFIKRWREHFVQTMSPKYLPNFWSVDREQK